MTSKDSVLAGGLSIKKQSHTTVSNPDNFSVFFIYFGDIVWSCYQASFGQLFSVIITIQENFEKIFVV